MSTRILIPLLVLLGVTKLGGITGPFLLATDRERIQVRIRATMGVLNLGAAVAAIPTFGPAGAALATGAAMLGLVVWEGVVVQRFLRPKYPWGFLGRIAVATGVMMMAVRAGQWGIGPDPGLIALLTLVAGGGGVYLAMILWLRPVSAEHGEILTRLRVPLLASLACRLVRPAPAAAG